MKTVRNPDYVRAVGAVWWISAAPLSPSSPPIERVLQRATQAAIKRTNFVVPRPPATILLWTEAYGD